LKDEDTMIQDILYGHSHSKRSSKCFVFLLEDKTIVLDDNDNASNYSNNNINNSNDNDKNTNEKVEKEATRIETTSRLYGICVILPRLLRVPVTNSANGKTVFDTNNKNEENNVNNNSGTSLNNSNNNNNKSNIDYVEYESTVCYAFITRFPFFEFFFQVIFDMITTERLTRMEAAIQQSESHLKYCRQTYQYLPTKELEDILHRLGTLKKPKFGEFLNFQMTPNMKQISYLRDFPLLNYAEHYSNLAEWALPSLLSWMPVETLVWAISLLMSEAKLVVVGQEAGMVSCAVMGLLVLLRPLEWVAPLIPMLPCKLIDFIDSPVPILVGLTTEVNDKSFDVASLLSRCWLVFYYYYFYYYYFYCFLMKSICMQYVLYIV
jgi:hypothetical protein